MLARLTLMNADHSVWKHTLSKLFFVSELQFENYQLLTFNLIKVNRLAKLFQNLSTNGSLREINKICQMQNVLSFKQFFFKFESS